MDFSELEATEGLRFSWNCWPSSRIDATRSIVPMATMWTPLQKFPDMPILSYEPVRCKGCEAVLNPYCTVDYAGKNWTCPFCFQRNYFPAGYANITEVNVPAELYPTYSTLEYALPQIGPSVPPAFLFVVDICQEAEDLALMKKQLLQAMALLPETALVGLISFGTMVNVHELGYAELPKVYVFRGEKEVTSKQLKEQLELSWLTPKVGEQAKAGGPLVAPPGSAVGGDGLRRFLLPYGDCEFALACSLEDLTPSAYPVAPGHRPRRATGSALAVAAALLEACVPSSPARILLFTSAAPTIGPGMVVGTDFGESIRTHTDIHSDNTRHYRKGVRFYTSLAQKLVERGHVLDIFAASLDQVGAAEARVAVETTGGVLVLAETFESEQIGKSLQKLFARDEQGYLAMAFEALVDVTTTREVKVTGALGPLCSMRKRTVFVSENEQGIGGTSQWKACALDSQTALTLFFEVVNQHSNPIPSGQAFFIQLVTQYLHGSGQRRLRVTTAARRFVDGGNKEDMGREFDQEAAAVIMARLATFKSEHEDVFDVIRWLDRLLVRLVTKYGEYEKDEMDSFRLGSHMTLYPQFMFHLRRSQFLQVFNNTPDETAFFRLMLNRQGVNGSLIMIQPTLISYSFEGPPTPVLLDVASIQADCILLFDAFFFVVVHLGASIAQWKKLKYHEDPAHETFRRLLEAPLADAQALVEERLPPPRLIVCEQHGSQARFLLAKLNPSITHNSNNESSANVIFTDDVSLEVFTRHLQKLAVES
eukprot:TRINITY_DN14953_c0_g1_i2.p1 TRINITY_DN14953_c0_g1~~TRINITY_DN14953_c0_g1_i2.p1  ORF type:complete len:764 (-),score=184.54 TRINITY_DN14953_c0_g1_i2:842-3133(-)